MKRSLSVWRFNPITGYWIHERSCADETASQWLAVFQKCDPAAQFKLSRNKPR